MGRAELDRGFVIPAHPHAPSVEPVVAGELVEKREERGRFDVLRRDAHETRERNVRGPRLLQQGGQFCHRTAALLRFLADIDLHEARHAAILLVHRPGQGLYQARPVERMNGVEQRDGILRLVRLQLADQVQLHRRMRFAQAGPFALRFLHAVFAEMPLAFAQQRLDRVRRMHLAHRDQRHVFGLAPRDLARLGDIRANLAQRSVCLFHRAAL